MMNTFKGKYQKSTTQFRVVYTPASENDDNLLYVMYESMYVDYKSDPQKEPFVANFLAEVKKKTETPVTVRVVRKQVGDYNHILEVTLDIPKVDYATMMYVQKMIGLHIIDRFQKYMDKLDAKRARQLKQDIEDNLDKRLGIDRAPPIEKASSPATNMTVSPVKRELDLLDDSDTIKAMLLKQTNCKYINISISLLDIAKPSLTLALSFDDQASWKNKILQNSRYAKFIFSPYDKVPNLKLISRNIKLTKFRTARVSTVAQVVEKIKKWADSQMTNETSVEKANIETAIKPTEKEDAPYPRLSQWVYRLKAGSSRTTVGGKYQYKVELSDEGSNMLHRGKAVPNMSDSNSQILTDLLKGKFYCRYQNPNRVIVAINMFMDYLVTRAPNKAKAPTQNLTPAKALKMFKDKGYKVVKNPSGSFTITPPKK